MKNIEEMKDYEFSELLSKTKFNVSVEEEKANNRSVDEDGDEVREEYVDPKIAPAKSKLSRYLSFATGFVYTILAPIILLLTIYFVTQKKFGFEKNDLVIIGLILLGILTGYWTLYNDIKKITAKKEKNNGSKDKKNK
ncbi:hypothetical protein [Streptobacillus canis]|uniref:hypothetical protein n=1 Tax=Streptobacillus canis TaxID=2678686 RepID=UPI0012E1C2F6|nr:hypothetical protein [Streptobacillus canis]